MRMLSVFFICIFTAGCFAPKDPLLLDDFEGELSANTVDFGAGNNSAVSVSASDKIFKTGVQSMKVDYKQVASGYMWAGRGFEMDVPGAGVWLVKPDKVKWNKYKGISFYFYGEGKGASIAFDIKDSNKEIWRAMISDDKKGWKKVELLFSHFFSRSDWQPGDAAVDQVMDYPVKSFQFEVRSNGKGTFYVDQVEVYGAGDA